MTGRYLTVTVRECLGVARPRVFERDVMIAAFIDVAPGKAVVAPFEMTAAAADVQIEIFSLFFCQQYNNFLTEMRSLFCAKKVKRLLKIET